MELFYLEKFFRSVINIRGNIASNINDRAIMLKMCHFILQLSYYPNFITTRYIE